MTLLEVGIVSDDTLLINHWPGDISAIACSHLKSDVRSMVSCVIEGDDSGTEGIQCGNILHQVVTKLTKIVQCGQRLVALSHDGPIGLQHTNGGGNLWLFSYSHNAPRANLVSKAWSHIAAGDASGHSQQLAASVPNTTDKEKLMREMARLRLKNELSGDPEHDDGMVAGDGTESGIAKSRSPSSDRFRAVYLIPDVEYLCGKLDAVKTLVRSQRYICVIPQAGNDCLSADSALIDVLQ